MKKLVALILVVVMALCFTACGQSKGSSQNAAVSEASGFIVPDAAEQEYVFLDFYSGDDFMRQMWEGFKDCGDMLGVKTTHIGGTGDDITQYLANFETAISMKPAGIAVLVWDADAYVDIINKAVDTGIPVVTAATGSPNSKESSTVLASSEAIGNFGADKLAEAMGGKGDVMVMFRLGDQMSVDRSAAFKARLAEKYPKMKVVAEVNTSLEGNEQVADASAALTANPSITGVYCTLGIEAGSISQACSELGKTDMKIVGQDEDALQLQCIIDGTVIGSITEDAYGEGWWPMLELYIEHNGFLGDRSALPNTMTTAVGWIDQANAQARLDALNERAKNPVS